MLSPTARGLQSKVRANSKCVRIPDVAEVLSASEPQFLEHQTLLCKQLSSTEEICFH